MYAKIGGQRMSEVAAKFVLEGEGTANENFTVCPQILNQICTELFPVLFDALLTFS